MMLHFMTICLDAMPWITRHLPEFQKLTVPWQWTVVEGVAQNVQCTSWCRELRPGVSTDGTHEYLRQLAAEHPGAVMHLAAPSWPGKVAMCNAALERMQPGRDGDGLDLLWQVDADELWTAQQIETVARLFQQHRQKNCARFWCRYFVGPGLVITNRQCYGNHFGEWLRVWRWWPGMRFVTHEPPRLTPLAENAFTREQMEAAGCVFEHMAYATEAQVAFKERYYGYAGAVAQWRALQGAAKPARVGDYLQWVTDGAVCDNV